MMYLTPRSNALAGRVADELFDRACSDECDRREEARLDGLSEYVRAADGVMQVLAREIALYQEGWVVPPEAWLAAERRYEAALKEVAAAYGLTWEVK